MTEKPDAALTVACPTLFRRGWPARRLDRSIHKLSPVDLIAEYWRLHSLAPQRAARGKRYLLAHAGLTSSNGGSNRREEHVAIALVNTQRRWPRLGRGWFRWLDYQVPLKAQQCDKGIGKVDLLGVTEDKRLLVSELKVRPDAGGRGDPPIAAFLEGLRYAAVLEASRGAIARELRENFGLSLAAAPPVVQIVGPVEWWRSWLDQQAAGPWARLLADVADRVAAGTGVSFEFAALGEAKLAYGPDGSAPLLERIPEIAPVDLRADEAIGAAVTTPDPASATAYDRELLERFHDWAARHDTGYLDGAALSRRPPVLAPLHVARNVLTPTDTALAERIRAAVHPRHRHRHFGSYKSSQALAQSVFGGLRECGRLDVLARVRAECGRPAFFDTSDGWTLDLEHEVATLGEPRRTSVDVWLDRAGRRVAVECKFTEREFGTCSRPRLTEKDAAWATQRCDGAYRAQAGRAMRCALSGIGVRYWENLPALFAWSSNRDHAPCPFASTYQLGRSALAATVGDDNRVDPAAGHALIIYDARNPAFDWGGDADRQWEAAVAASRIPGLLRRVSWQRIAGVLRDEADLVWLADGLRGKYGFEADGYTHHSNGRWPASRQLR